jgi:hypothetical protein
VHSHVTGVSRIDSLTQMRVRLTHATTQVSPTSLERIQQAWAGIPMQELALAAGVVLPGARAGVSRRAWLIFSRATLST